MKKEIVIAGIVILVLGTLFFALSQENRIQETETLTLAYNKQIETPNGFYCSTIAQLQSYKNYKFNVTMTSTTDFGNGVYPNVNVTDPTGIKVNYTYQSPVDFQYWDHESTFGVFTSNVAGGYKFELVGFVGNPNISLSVFQVGSVSQTFYPFDYMVYIAIALWVIGLILALLGVMKTDRVQLPPPQK